MYQRNILQKLNVWKNYSNRKPLVLRGARQVGKTTAVNEFGKTFKQYIYLNLELPSDKECFKYQNDLEKTLQSIFFQHNKNIAFKAQTLIFIDEIQEMPHVINLLRYFYEEEPSIAVIAAGSMLESLFSAKLSFPVGRVDYMVLRPVSFSEFLGALNENIVLEQFNIIPLNNFAHAKILDLFHTYAIIGGMPEIVAQYAQNKDLTSLQATYNQLLQSYLDDAEKYASNKTQLQLIRHAIKSCYIEAGKRIKFHGFGNSSYNSREMGEALRSLEKAMLIHLIYPNTSTSLPIVPDLKKSPRLHVLDTGLLNFFVGIQKDILGTDDLSAIYQGTMIEHLVGQEILSQQSLSLSALNFWVREKNSSTAEIDYIINYNGKIIPIEVKSGKDGRLRSLHIFMDECNHNVAVRFYAGEFAISNVETLTGKKYNIINLPYYLASQIELYLDWYFKEYK